MFFFLQVFALAVAWTGNRLANGAGASMSVTWAIVMQAVFTISCIIVFLWRRWSPIESFRLILAKTPSLGTPDKTPYSDERRTSKRLIRLSAWVLLAWATIAALGSIVIHWVISLLAFWHRFLKKSSSGVPFCASCSVGCRNVLKKVDPCQVHAHVPGWPLVFRPYSLLQLT